MFIEVDFLGKGYIGYEGMCDIYVKVYDVLNVRFLYMWSVYLM